MTTRLNTIDKDELQKVLNESSSYRDALRRIGYNGSTLTYYYRVLKKRIQKDNLDITKLNTNRSKTNKRPIKSLDDMLKNTTLHVRTASLKKKLIDSGLLKYECRDCKNHGIWMDKPLVLQLEHIDGNHKNNTLSNLTLLCPNCHSQTSTYGGKKLKKKTVIKICKKCNKQIQKNSTHCISCVDIPQRKPRYNSTKSELEDMILRQNMSYVSIGKKFGVTDNAIKKRCKRMGISLPVRRKSKKM